MRLPLVDKPRFTKTSQNRAQKGFLNCCSPVRLKSKAESTAAPVQQSTLSSRAFIHPEGLHNAKYLSSLALTFFYLKLLA